MLAKTATVTVAVDGAAVAAADAVVAGYAAVVVAAVAGSEVGAVVAGADRLGLIAHCLGHRFPTS